MTIFPLYLPGYYLASFLLQKGLFLFGYDPVMGSILGGGLAACLLVWWFVE